MKKVKYINDKDTLAYNVDWKPLEAMSELHPDKIDCGDFMYMGTRVDGSICLYKHRITRGYLNIDTEGYCWQYWTLPNGNCGYFQIAQESAIERMES